MPAGTPINASRHRQKPSAMVIKKYFCGHLDGVVLVGILSDRILCFTQCRAKKQSGDLLLSPLIFIGYWKYCFQLTKFKKLSTIKRDI